MMDYTSSETLTEEGILKMAAAFERPPEWVVKIRDADRVTVHQSSYTPKGEAFTIDLPDGPVGVVTVLCHPEDRLTIAKIVDEIRRPLGFGDTP